MRNALNLLIINISFRKYDHVSPLLVLLGLAKHLESTGGLVPLVLVHIPPVVAAEITPPSAEKPSPSVHWTERTGGVHQVEAALVLVVVVGILRPTSSELRRILVHVAPVLVGVASPIGYLQYMCVLFSDRTLVS